MLTVQRLFIYRYGVYVSSLSLFQMRSSVRTYKARVTDRVSTLSKYKSIHMYLQINKYYRLPLCFEQFEMDIL